jgi:hypothetical protein
MHMERVSTEKGIVLKRSLSGLEPGATADKMTGQQMVSVRHLRATAPQATLYARFPDELPVTHFGLSDIRRVLGYS